MTSPKKKKVKLHWLNWGKSDHLPTRCECGGSITILCSKLFEQMTRKPKS